MGNAVRARLGRFRSWPNDALLLDEPLALAEEKMSRLNRIYAKATREVWDGPAVFRAALEKHGGIQLSQEKRAALVHPISMLMWGELAAWIVAAELAERLDDPDARLAASSQVFDEARRYHILRLRRRAAMPVPKLDPYFAIGVRRLLDTKDLTVKLFAMQLLAEGTALEIFKFLEEAQIEPVLSEILPYIEKDESRHVGLGVLHLPERLRTMSRRQLERVRKVTWHRRPVRCHDPLRGITASSAPTARLIRRADNVCSISASASGRSRERTARSSRPTRRRQKATRTRSISSCRSRGRNRASPRRSHAASSTSAPALCGVNPTARSAGLGVPVTRWAYPSAYLQASACRWALRYRLASA
jgi:hypothetical protein